MRTFGLAILANSVLEVLTFLKTTCAAIITSVALQETKKKKNLESKIQSIINTVDY